MDDRHQRLLKRARLKAKRDKAPEKQKQAEDKGAAAQYGPDDKMVEPTSEQEFGDAAIKLEEEKIAAEKEAAEKEKKQALDTTNGVFHSEPGFIFDRFTADIMNGALKGEGPWGRFVQNVVIKPIENTGKAVYSKTYDATIGPAAKGTIKVGKAAYKTTASTVKKGADKTAEAAKSGVKVTAKAGKTAYRATAKTVSKGASKTAEAIKSGVKAAPKVAKIVKQAAARNRVQARGLQRSPARNKAQSKGRGRGMER